MSASLNAYSREWPIVATHFYPYVYVRHVLFPSQSRTRSLQEHTGPNPVSDVTRRSVAVHRRQSHILIDDLGAIDLTEHLTAITEDQTNIDVSLDHDITLDD